MICGVSTNWPRGWKAEGMEYHRCGSANLFDWCSPLKESSQAGEFTTNLQQKSRLSLTALLLLLFLHSLRIYIPKSSVRNNAGSSDDGVRYLLAQRSNAKDHSSRFFWRLQVLLLRSSFLINRETYTDTRTLFIRDLMSGHDKQQWGKQGGGSVSGLRTIVQTLPLPIYVAWFQQSLILVHSYLGTKSSRVGRYGSSSGHRSDLRMVTMGSHQKNGERVAARCRVPHPGLWETLLEGNPTATGGDKSH